MFKIRLSSDRNYLERSATAGPKADSQLSRLNHAPKCELRRVRLFFKLRAWGHPVPGCSIG
jgi:hypothetical protein